MEEGGRAPGGGTEGMEIIVNTKDGYLTITTPRTRTPGGYTTQFTKNARDCAGDADAGGVWGGGVSREKRRRAPPMYQGEMSIQSMPGVEACPRLVVEGHFWGGVYIWCQS